MPPIVPCSSVSSRTMSVAEVRLAQTAGQLGMRGGVAAARTPSAAIHVASDGDALGLLAVGAQLLVKEDGRRAASMRDSSVRLAVLVPEEPRVAQPRGQHALGVAGDDLRLLGLRVGDRQERRLQLAVLVHHREVVLVVNHRRRQHFLGELKELDREVPGDDRRVLDEVGHFLQQRRVRRDQTADAAAQPARVRLELAPDPRLALGAVEDDEVLEQPRLVVLERLDLDRPPGAAARRQKAMAVGVASPTGCPGRSGPAPAPCGG